MKITINTKELSKALTKTAPLVSGKSPMTAFRCFHLNASKENSALTVSASNGDVTMAVTVVADVATDGSCLVGGEGLARLAKMLPGETCEMQMKTPHLVVESDRSRYKLNATDASEWPFKPLVIPGGAIEVNGQIIRALLGSVSYAHSVDDTRFIINGINLVSDGAETLRAAATDGHRIAIDAVRHDGAKTIATASGVVIHRDTVKMLCAILDTESTAKWSTDGSTLCVAADDAVLCARLIDGKFPDYMQIVPSSDKDGVIDIKADARNLSNALARVSKILKQDSAGCKVIAAKGRLDLSAESPDAGTASEDVDCEASADAKIKVNPDYLREALDHVGAGRSDGVIIQVFDSMSPVVVRLVDNSDRVAVVMPMRM
jgi:DNA polymerase-3 subunit beta